MIKKLGFFFVWLVIGILFVEAGTEIPNLVGSAASCAIALLYFVSAVIDGPQDPDT